MTAAALPLAPSSGHSRRLAISIFADERTRTPVKSAPATWSYVLKLHTLRTIRPGKPGPMLGGYALNGTRSNANVPFRSVIQLDIDTQGAKDKATGRIVEVTHPAPPLSDIRSGIDEYEWCAASSHGHESQRGVPELRDPRR